ncbi:MAG: iron-containing alcohol dehydrogenase [candidate division KSB1 bacterium]|nr:iron-containing alcohol dehydrogenase [candidate division KSB1 bacterium]
MRPVTFYLPKTLVFGNGCISQFLSDFAARGLRRPLVLINEEVLRQLTKEMDTLRHHCDQVTIDASILGEPDVALVERILNLAREAQIDSVIGIGGGSILDVAKLVAALYDGGQNLQEVFGIGKLKGRSVYLACLPTTAGTGSEVSPNSIIFDPEDNLKKGVISPYLVPDASYVDPVLTRTLPPNVTASTGLDALTHCIEAYTNKFAHPAVDLYALEGVRLLGAHLRRAVENGEDLDARAAVALGSLYGGLCLGPVNTAAVHALAYPLGSRFHVAHGVSNAVLLPYVMEINLPAAVERYAEIGMALGAEPGPSAEVTARAGIEQVRALIRDCGLPQRLSELNIPEEAIDEMVDSALTVTRLLKNNPLEVTREVARAVYSAAF